MSFYFRAKKRALGDLQFAAPPRFFEQFGTRHSAKPEGQNFLDQRIDRTRTLPCDPTHYLLYSAEDAKGGDACVAGSHQIHLHSQIERALDGVRDALIELLDPQIKFAVETDRVAEQNICQFPFPPYANYSLLL